MKRPPFSNIKQVVSNNGYYIKKAFRCSPLYFCLTVFWPPVFGFVCFFEWVITPMYLVNALQTGKSFHQVLIFLIFLVTLMALALAYGSFQSNMISPRFKAKLQQMLNSEVYDKALKMDLDRYENTEFYNDFIWAMNNSVSKMNDVLNSFSRMMRAFVDIGVSTILMLSLNKVSFIFVAVSLVSVTFINAKLGKINFMLDNEKTQFKRRSDYINRVFYLADYAKDIRMTNVGKKLNESFDESNAEIIAVINKYAKQRFWQSFLSNYVFTTFVLRGLFVTYLSYLSFVLKAIQYGTMIGLFNSVNRIQFGMRELNISLPDLYKHSLYIERIKIFFDYQPQITSNERALPVSNVTGVIEFRNVGFKYSGSDSWILKGLNVTIHSNEKNAIVGYNGAGKSTFVKLLMRLYDVTEGEILYDGVNIKDYDLLAYREMFGATFQDFQLFAASVAENVAMDKVEDTNTNAQSKIKTVLQISGFGERLEKMPLGMSTPLTREFEDNGTNLSGGEAQKIAIARTFYKDSPFLVLDEPSSALDPVSEYNFNYSMLKAAENKTVVFVSHRLSTTRFADKILVIDGGKIAEEGSHEELMAQSDKYAEMFNMQAEKYQ